MSLLPKFLYSNVLRGITPTWSGTTVSGSPPENSIDWRDFSYFQADTGNLDFTMAVDTDIDGFSAYVANFTGTGAETITLQYESAPSVFSSLSSINPAGGKLVFAATSAVTVLAGRKIRLAVSVGTGSLLIRQLVVGEIMTAERGQWASATNPNFYQGIQVTNTISQNGSLLGRSIKRLERKGKIQLDHLSAAWVRSTWEPFSQHMARYPFIYAWNPRDYNESCPNGSTCYGEVAWAFSQGIKAPSHTQNGLLSVDVPVRFLVADENAI
jgi:hypothetical protein